MTQPLPIIEPAALSGYLESKGWHRDGDWRGAGVWSLDATGQLLIPDHFEYQDDSELIREAIQKLAAFEERPQQDLILDITDPMVDTQFFRTQPDTPSGTIPLPSGLKAVQGVHRLLGTAARTPEYGHRLLHEGRPSSAVDGFLHRVLLGTARPGSYVLTARVPVAAAQSPQLDLFGQPATDRNIQALDGREVVIALDQAIHAAWTAASLVTSGKARLDVFDDYMLRGVSANLCKALGELGGYGKDRPVEIGFAWARGLPGPEAAQPISFSGSMVSVLARAGSELEHLAKSGEAQITGQVETLNLTKGEEPRIRIVGELRAESQTIRRRALWVVVSMSEYDGRSRRSGCAGPSKPPDLWSPRSAAWKCGPTISPFCVSSGRSAAYPRRHEIVAGFVACLHKTLRERLLHYTWLSIKRPANAALTETSQ